jgi:hypothetical protein
LKLSEIVSGSFRTELLNSGCKGSFYVCGRYFKGANGQGASPLRSLQSDIIARVMSRKVLAINICEVGINVSSCMMATGRNCIIVGC